MNHTEAGSPSGIILDDREVASSDALALNAVRRALTCLESRGSSKPLVALTPSRLVQLQRYQKRHSPTCSNRTLGEPLRCAVGACVRQVCRCFFGFTGVRCDVYPGRCWLLYCYLRGCYSARGANLRCVCDPALYGSEVLSGLYWYEDDLSDVYKPPPPSWIDNIPTLAEDDPEASYVMEGADEEIDMSLYQRAIGGGLIVPTLDSRPLPRLPSRTTGRPQTRPDPSQWNETIHTFLTSQIAKLSRKSGKQMLHLLQKTQRPSSRPTMAISDRPGTSSLDMPENLKFAYEDYVPLSGEKVTVNRGSLLCSEGCPFVVLALVIVWNLMSQLEVFL